MISSPEGVGDRLISKAEACERLGNIGRTKLTEMLLRGEIASVKLVGRRLISSNSLDCFIAAAIAANAATLER